MDAEVVDKVPDAREEEQQQEQQPISEEPEQIIPEVKSF